MDQEVFGASLTLTNSTGCSSSDVKHISARPLIAISVTIRPFDFMSLTTQAGIRQIYVGPDRFAALPPLMVNVSYIT